MPSPLSNQALAAKIKKRLIQLSFQGQGATFPNPCVAAVLEKNGNIIASGHTASNGGRHAERLILEEAAKRFGRDEIQDSKLWVTLEPCCHQGKNPPCTDAIREYRIGQVNYVFDDPNPLVAGKGIARLKRAKVRVFRLDQWQLDFRPFFDGFFGLIRDGRPRIWFKTATTIDGMTADGYGGSKWITGPLARQTGHRLRSKADAILVGGRTFLNDRPNLLARDGRIWSRDDLAGVQLGGVDSWHSHLFKPRSGKWQQPHRFIVLSEGHPMPALTEHIRALAKGSAPGDGVTLIFLTGPTKSGVESFLRHIARSNRLELEKDKGQWRLVAADGHWSVWTMRRSRNWPAQILKKMGQAQFQSLMIEGGAATLGAFGGYAGPGDRLYHFQAPKLLLAEGRPSFGSERRIRMASAQNLLNTAWAKLGPDFFSAYTWPHPSGQPEKAGQSGQAGQAGHANKANLSSQTSLTSSTQRNPSRQAKERPA